MAMVVEQLRMSRGGQFVGEREQQNPRLDGVILEETILEGLWLLKHILVDGYLTTMWQLVGGRGTGWRS